jgi:hypothetical protein
MKFEKTFCSQCGGEFGPGDHGFSHCSTHRTLAKAKADPMWATRRIEQMSQALEVVKAAGEGQTSFHLTKDEWAKINEAIGIANASGEYQ